MNQKFVALKRSHNHCNSYNCERNKTVSYKPRTLKKVISSKALVQYEHSDRNSYSTGIINHAEKQSHSKSKKSTKSDLTFDKDVPKYNVKSNVCKQCGDMVETVQDLANQSKISNPYVCPRNKFASKYKMARQSSNNLANKHLKAIQQYYKNENFALSSESVHIAQSENKQKPSLSTINETIETTISDIKSLKNVLYEIYPESTPEEIGCFDLEKQQNIKEINEFRRRNYFECHSAKSRIKVKGSTTSLGEHKCQYRFYLNERLFPVPLNTDHHNNIRCIDCKLPVEESRISSSINGTVQAKVKFNNQVQDMILMLPVKEHLIIKEQRKELQSLVNPEVLYFGIIKLKPDGDSIYNSTCPSNSLALKYQKGYKEFRTNDNYEYESVASGDVIII